MHDLGEGDCIAQTCVGVACTGATACARGQCLSTDCGGTQCGLRELCSDGAAGGPYLRWYP